MALIEKTLFGEHDKVEIAIKRLREFEPLALQFSENGYLIADSGGKDSSVILYLAYLAKVKFEMVHSHTTADHPITVYFVRETQKIANANGYKYTIEYPHYKGIRTNIWKLIEVKGLPTRLIRWCCAVCKEGCGSGKFVVTGVRWAESVARRKQRGIAEVIHRKKEESLILTNDNTDNRRLIENCVKRGKRMLNPIIDWEDSDVWEFIKLYELRYNPLYDQGYKRVGCVGCPCSTNQIKELDANPKYKALYLNSAKKYIEYRKSRGLPTNYPWDTYENYFKWWVGIIKIKNIDQNQLFFDFDEMYIEENDIFDSNLLT